MLYLTFRCLNVRYSLYFLAVSPICVGTKKVGESQLLVLSKNPLLKGMGNAILLV